MSFNEVKERTIPLALIFLVCLSMEDAAIGIFKVEMNDDCCSLRMVDPILYL